MNIGDSTEVGAGAGVREDRPEWHHISSPPLMESSAPVM